MCIGAKSEKEGRNIFKEILCDVLVLNSLIILSTARADSRYCSGGREGLNPKHVVRNFFLLKLVTVADTQVAACTTLPEQLRRSQTAFFPDTCMKSRWSSRF